MLDAWANQAKSRKVEPWKINPDRKVYQNTALTSFKLPLSAVQDGFWEGVEAWLAEKRIDENAGCMLSFFICKHPDEDGARPIRIRIVGQQKTLSRPQQDRITHDPGWNSADEPTCIWLIIRQLVRKYPS